jgi:isopenicillin-N epimerase
MPQEITPHSASRRAFFRTLAAAGALPSLAQALAAAPGAEPFWKVVRAQFAFRDDNVPMNAANLCPSPVAVADRVTELTRDIDVDCSFQNRAKFEELLEASRSKVAAQLGVSPDEIALVRNASEANNTINNGLKLEQGDEIVLWDQNHPTNNVAWQVRAARFGYQVKTVATPGQPESAADLIAPFERALTARTRVLALTHVSNVSGVRLPVEELAGIAHQRGIHVHVDGAQTWGAFKLDLRALGCDSFAASAHKWFTGPKEVGLLYVRGERILDIWPNVVAPGWGAGPETTLKGARKFESMGQRDDAALTAIGATADFHSTVGVERIEARVMELAADLKQALTGLGAKLVTPEAPKLSGGVCIVEVPAANRQKVMDRLYREYGVAGSTSGGLRLCPHYYNTRAHIERAAEGVKAMRGLLA